MHIGRDFVSSDILKYKCISIIMIQNKSCRRTERKGIKRIVLKERIGFIEEKFREYDKRVGIYVFDV